MDTDQNRFSEFDGQVRTYHWRKKQVYTIAGGLFLLIFWGAATIGDVSAENLIRGLPGLFDYVGQTIPEIRATHLQEDVREWQWGFRKWMAMIWDTVIIATLATILGFAVACVGCFFASRNLNNSVYTIFAARRFFEICRTIPELIYAMIFVYAIGIGPLAGILALAVHSAGALGKLFAEVNENAAAGPLEGIMSAGGRWSDQVRMGVLPQVFPNFLSYGLLRFEINIRAATVVGFVGAGGIGTELMFNIRQFQHTTVSAIVLWIVLLVMAVDFGSEWLRRRVSEGSST